MNKLTCKSEDECQSPDGAIWDQHIQKVNFFLQRLIDTYFGTKSTESQITKLKQTMME